MPGASVTSKGQITIPVQVRRALGVGKGDTLQFTPVENGYLMTAPKRSIKRLAGFFGPHEGPPVSIEQMNSDISAAAAGLP